jgi:hypothetical protein
VADGTLGEFSLESRNAVSEKIHLFEAGLAAQTAPEACTEKFESPDVFGANSLVGPPLVPAPRRDQANRLRGPNRSKGKLIATQQYFGLRVEERGQILTSTVSMP